LERTHTTLTIDEENPILINAQENSVCDVCGEEFDQPLFAEITSGDHTEEYYACPRCLTKVREVESQQKAKVEEQEEEEQSAEIQHEDESGKTEETPACPYHLGFLKKRQKNSPIPETCFTCNKMIECTR
jgi:DNA-directed RNA polymerase subunit RPC12/RpoP